MNRRRNRRRGASVLEMSIVLSVFLVTTFGMFDLGIAVFRYHVLSNAACQGARRAIVHGTLASVEGTWGPTTINQFASSSGTAYPIINGSHDGIAKMLVGCDLSKTTINVQWLDSTGSANGNSVGNRVQVTVSSAYTPVSFFLTAGTLTAASTMQIAY